ncbi:hypothetical protein [Marinimicrobium sp. ABcell2]|uniref:hypothetical protein n=1 Tax=Marinimicrobium sp. ABcell2 TaxID=3069751 RepID=UPI0027AFFEEB|nr:hypothetical protein [Marinimicrobium sp. ABcell2]MDQ2077434.1 hypothetical protein [Marinimicrobium sp. ABcell2]
MRTTHQVKPFRIVELYQALSSTRTTTHSLVAAARDALEQASFYPALAASIQSVIEQGEVDDPLRSSLCSLIENCEPVYRYRASGDVWTVYRFELSTGEEHWCATVETEVWAERVAAMGNELIAPNVNG